MTNIVKSESNGRFFLSYTRDWRSCRGDLGLGTAQQSCRFLSDEGRTYYIQMVSQGESMGATIDSLESELADLKTVSGANRNLREVRAARRAERSAE